MCHRVAVSDLRFSRLSSRLGCGLGGLQFSTSVVHRVVVVVPVALVFWSEECVQLPWNHEAQQSVREPRLPGILVQVILREGLPR
jgi:hypothetical protein